MRLLVVSVVVVELLVSLLAAVDDPELLGDVLLLALGEALLSELGEAPAPICEVLLPALGEVLLAALGEVLLLPALGEVLLPLGEAVPLLCVASDLPLVDGVLPLLEVCAIARLRPPASAAAAAKVVSVFLVLFISELLEMDTPQQQ